MRQLTTYSARATASIDTFLALFFLFIMIFRSNGFMDDPFHQGEWFAAAINFLPNVNAAANPLTIHGAVDIIPTLIAERLFGGNNYFLPTFFTYKVLDFLSAATLVAVLSRLSKGKPNKEFFLLATSVVAPLLVGYRDLFFLVSLYIFISLHKIEQNSFKICILQAVFGGTVAFGMFWSYDRGIAGAISLGAVTLWEAYKNRQYLLSLVSFTCTFAALSLGFDIFSLHSYLSNIYTLAVTSGQWSYGWQTRAVILSLFTITLNGTLITLLAASIKRGTATHNISLVILLSLTTAFMLKIGINRADAQHIYMSLWPSLGVAALLLGDRARHCTWKTFYIATILALSLVLSVSYHAYGLVLTTGIITFSILANKKPITSFPRKLFLLALMVGFVIFAAKGLEKGKYSWLTRLETPPSNNSMVTDSVIWAADRLLNSGADCVFDLSNHGLINALTRKPSCSRFTYPVYADSRYENELVQAINFSHPSALVYSSKSWSYHIDGKPMSDRFPTLNKLLIDKYKNEECSNDYCIRYRDQQK